MMSNFCHNVTNGLKAIYKLRLRRVTVMSQYVTMSQIHAAVTTVTSCDKRKTRVKISRDNSLKQIVTL